MGRKIIEVLFTGGWSEHYRSHFRPVWEITLLLPLSLLYYPARWYVDWMDGK